MEKKKKKERFGRKNVNLEGSMNALVSFQGVPGTYISSIYIEVTVTVPWHIRLRDNTLIL